MKHLKTCAVGTYIPCPSHKSLHSEAADEHWWSGWPGAVCMKCGSEDVREICLADSCRCKCHDDLSGGV